jgi:DNA adenine methylase
MRGFLRWAGSKRQLLPKLKTHWREAPGRSYIEPFAGSACLFFDLEPKAAILGDLNHDLVGALQALKDDTDAVIESLKRMRKGKANYYRIRKQDPGQLSPSEHAARFIFLNKYCFNGLYRTNLAGQFNVPYAKPKPQASGLDYVAIRKAADLLHRATLIAGDFASTVEHAKPGDFVYLDPPYFSTSKRIFGEYMPSVFGAEDLNRLDSILTSLDAKGVHFLVSYIWSKEHRELFERWHVTRVRTKRNIAGFASDRRGAYEILATNMELDHEPR